MWRLLLLSALFLTTAFGQFVGSPSVVLTPESGAVADYTKLKAYAFADSGVIIRTIDSSSSTSSAMKDALASGPRGILIVSGNNAIHRDKVIALYDYVRRGGHAIVVVGPRNASVSPTWQEYFQIGFATEELAFAPVLHRDGGRYLPMWSGLELGLSRAARWGVFFVPGPGAYSVALFESKTSKIARAVVATRNLGNGRILFIAGAEHPFWIGHDEAIDLFDNRKAVRALVEWLLGNIG